MSPFAEVLAIVPARGGSKGIPRKNLVQLAGKPLLVHTLDPLREVRAIGRRVVSTDSAEIGRVASEHGAEVVWRPESLSDDSASSESALLHCLEHLRAADGYEPHLVVLLQATSPLPGAKDIEEAIATLVRNDADSVFSAGPLRGFVWRCESGAPRPLNFDPRHRPRRQEAPEDLVENGSIYVFKPWVLREQGCRLGGRIAVYRMSALDSLEIDTPEDLLLADLLLQRRHSEALGAET